MTFFLAVRCRSSWGSGHRLLAAPCVLVSLLGVLSCGEDPVSPKANCIALADTLDFGSVLVGGSRVRACTLVNSGQAPLQAAPRTDPADFVLPGLDSTGVLNLAPGDTLALAVRFAPTRAGTQLGTLIFGDDACPGVVLRGKGEPSACAVSPEEVNFGAILVGESWIRLVTLSNGGAADLETRVWAEGPDFAVEGVDSVTMVTVGAGEVRSLTVTFAPVGEGDRSGELRFSAADCGGVALRGTGEIEACGVEPGEMDFGAVLVGLTGEQAVVVTNRSVRAMDARVESDSPEFGVNGDATVRVGARSSLRLPVLFAPTAPGERTGSLTLGGTGCPPVQLRGVGETGTCLLDVTEVDFELVLVGGREERVLEIENRGASVLETARPEVDSQEFELGGLRDGGMLRVEPGATAEVVVAFVPKGPGEKTAQVVFPDSRCPGVTLRGRGEVSSCAVEPQVVDFGRVPVSEEPVRTVRVTNTGTLRLSGDAETCDPAFEIVAGGGLYDLGPGEGRDITVRFRPVRSGAYVCELDFGTGRCAVSLTGSATQTWRVLADGTGDAPTVQAAIDSTADRDVVLVGPGTYYETINLRGRKIHLTGEQGRDVTILDGSRGDDSVVVCESGETNETVIEGFTITGGKGRIRAVDDRMGGGILCLDSTPIIQNNAIVRNFAINPSNGPKYSWGGGMSYGRRESSPELMGSLEFRNNLVQDNQTSSQGGGLVLSEACIVERNVIVGNQAGKDGGGLHVARGRVVLLRNLIAENVAGDHGGGIYITNSGYSAVPPGEIVIGQNLVVGNSALGVDGFTDCSGGAIWVYGGAWVHHNTILFNQAESREFPAAGGVCLFNTGGGTVIEYNLIYGSNEGGVVASRPFQRPFEADVLRNLLFNNGPVDIYELDPEWWDLRLVENIFEDPRLCVEGRDSDGGVAANSPALTQTWGVIGAVGEPRCGSVKMGSTWRAIRARHGP